MYKPSSFLLCFIFVIGCQSMTEAENTAQMINAKNAVVSSAEKELYDPTQDQDVLNAFDDLYKLSPTEEDIRFEPTEFIYFDTPQKTPIRKAYSVLYKAAHKQRLALAPYCAKGAIIDADCNTWWRFEDCEADQPNCEAKITPASAEYRTGCSIDNKTTYTNTVFPIGKNFFNTSSVLYPGQTPAPSKEEQLDNFFRIECK